MDVMVRTTFATAGPKSRIHRAPVANGLDELSDALASIRQLAIIAGDELWSIPRSISWHWPRRWVYARLESDARVTSRARWKTVSLRGGRVWSRCASEA